MNETSHNVTGPGGRSQKVTIFLFKFYSTLVLVVGLIGNTACVLAVTVGPARLRRCVARHFLIAICTADLLSLAALAVTWTETMTGWRPSLFEVVCKLTTFSGYYGALLCSYFIVQMTFTRFHAVKWPLIHRTRVTKNHIQATIIVTGILGFIYYAWTLVVFSVFEINPKHNPGHRVCNLEEKFIGLVKVYDVLAIILVFATPFIIIAGLNFWLASTILVRNYRPVDRTRSVKCKNVTISKPRCVVKSAGGTSTGASQIETTLSSTKEASKDHLLEMRVHSRSANQSLNRSRSARSARRLIMVSLIYIAMNLPCYVVRICIHCRVAVPPVLQFIAFNLLTGQYSVNCFLYSTVLTSAQANFIKMFTQRRVNGEISRSHTLRSEMEPTNITGDKKVSGLIEFDRNDGTQTI